MRGFSYNLYWLGELISICCRFIIMKLDTSGLESTAPHLGAICEPFSSFASAPSFDLPVITDVSSNARVFI